MNIKMKLCVALIVSSPFLSYAEDEPKKKDKPIIIAKLSDSKDQVRFREMIDKSVEAYSAIVKGPHGEVPSNVLKNAECIAVLPGVNTAAVVVGGSYGNGLASCKQSDKSWSEPAPIKLNQASIGLQAGAKSADLILFFQNKESVKALKTGSFGIGTDMSAVAGTYDSSMETTNPGVLVYSRTEGMFAGVSVNGGKIGKDQNEVARFYGKDVDYTALLESKVAPESSGYTKTLTRLFP